jgi:HPt (histidine-containing phosphotransfer) domain-containing protein
MTRFGAILFALLLTLPASALDEAARAEAQGRIAEWERAAVNREWAAITRINQASALQGRATKLQAGPFDDTEARQAAHTEAGETHVAAARAYAAAADNFDKAASNWEQLDELSTSIGRKAQGKTARRAATVAFAEGTAACRLAAQAYELAAQAFAPDRGNQVSQSALASQHAAVWREKLASR